MSLSQPASALVLLPECEARQLLGGRNLRLRLLRPPYAALGVGALRVLRVTECDAVTEYVAGYEAYERLTFPPVAS